MTTTTHYDQEAVRQLVLGAVPSATFEAQLSDRDAVEGRTVGEMAGDDGSGPVVTGEVAYLLPRDQAHQFAGLIRQLRQEQQRLGLGSFAITVTTLEEVFLRLAHKAEEDEMRADSKAHVYGTTASTDSDADISSAGSGSGREGGGKDDDPHLTSADLNELGGLRAPGMPSAGGVGRIPQSHPFPRALENAVPLQPTVGTQIRTIFRRRWLQAKRDKKGIWLQCILPIIIVGLSITFRSLQNINPSSSLDSVVFSFAPLASLTAGAAAHGWSLTLPYSPYVDLSAINSLSTAAMNEYMQDVMTQYTLQASQMSSYIPAAAEMTAANATTRPEVMKFLYKQHYAMAAVFMTDASNPPVAAGEVPTSVLLELVYNTSFTHIVPTMITTMSSAMLRQQLVSAGVGVGPYPLMMSSFDPWPRLPDEEPKNVGSFLSSMLMGFYIALGFCTIPALQV